MRKSLDLAIAEVSVKLNCLKAARAALGPAPRQQREPSEVKRELVASARARAEARAPVAHEGGGFGKSFEEYIRSAGQ